VIIGVSAIVFLASFAYGLERLVTNEVTSGNAFLLIDVGAGNSQIITLADANAKAIKELPGVKDVYAMTSIGAKSKVGDKSMDVTFYGANQSYLDKAGMVLFHGVELTGSGDELLVNTAFLKFFSAGSTDVLGKTANFDIVIPKDLTGKADNTEIADQAYKITGITNDDSSPKVYTNLGNLKEFDVASYNQFKVEVTSQDKVPEIRKQIENMGLKTQYVGDTVSQINQVFGIFRAILVAFGLITLIVATLGMFNTLTISLLERIKEIALMKMLGMRKKDINNVFLTESLLLGVLGGLLGLLLGVYLGKLANLILNHYARSMGGETVSVFFYPVSFIVIVVLISVLIGFLTGIYPARRAAKVNPLDVLRYE
jgi:putative ABC transport system permease protein